MIKMGYFGECIEPEYSIFTVTLVISFAREGGGGPGIRDRGKESRIETRQQARQATVEDSEYVKIGILNHSRYTSRNVKVSHTMSCTNASQQVKRGVKCLRFHPRQRLSILLLRRVLTTVPQL